MVWDGDEELYEIQMPGGDTSAYLENDTAQVVLPAYTEEGIKIDPNRYYGRVAYTNALGIDQPIAITRINYADRVNDLFFEVPFMARAPFMISPLWNERGQMYSGTYTDGTTLSCQQQSGVGADTIPRCIHFGSADSWFAYERPKHKRSAWHGSLVEDRAEQSGILYRRNRYYDPEKGKFTQEDPVGLASGVNLYSFADGDPVNFGDPFGLWPEWMKKAGAIAKRYVARRAADLSAPCDVSCAAGMAAGMAGGAGRAAGAGARLGGIERITRTLRSRFGEETRTFTKPDGAVQREWINPKSGMKHVLRGPETDQIQAGGPQVRHWNYEQQVPRGAGRYKTVQNVHLDANGNPIR